MSAFAALLPAFRGHSPEREQFLGHELRAPELVVSLETQLIWVQLKFPQNHKHAYTNSDRHRKTHRDRLPCPGMQQARLHACPLTRVQRRPLRPRNVPAIGFVVNDEANLPRLAHVNNLGRAFLQMGTPKWVVSPKSGLGSMSIGRGVYPQPLPGRFPFASPLGVSRGCTLETSFLVSNRHKPQSKTKENSRSFIGRKGGTT